MLTPSPNSDLNNSFTGSSIPPLHYDQVVLFCSNLEWMDNGTAIMPVSTNEELYGGSKDEQLDNLTESDVVVPQLVGGGDDNGITNTYPIAKNKRIAAHDKFGIEDLKLLQYGKTRAEAAESLGVSVPTFKRICRKHNIPSWPLKNKKRDLSAEIYEEPALSHITNPVFAMQPEPETEIQPNPAELSTVIAKVQYDENDFIKFEISSASKLADIQEEISKRLNLMDGSYIIRYFDEEGDLVLITNDDDVMLCMRSLKTANVKMQVSPRSSNRMSVFKNKHGVY